MMYYNNKGCQWQPLLLIVDGIAMRIYRKSHHYRGFRITDIQ